jgi:hypothetical protein
MLEQLAVSAGASDRMLFLCAGLAWAGYTVAMRQARLDGLHAAAIAAVDSLVLYVPVYAAVLAESLLRASVADVALQAVVQGILTAIVALLLYGRMVGILGAIAGAAFVALTPATTALPGLLRSTGLRSPLSRPAFTSLAGRHCPGYEPKRLLENTRSCNERGSEKSPRVCSHR